MDYVDVDPIENDSATIRTYAGRGQIHRFLRTLGWKIPIFAYALLLAVLILVY